MAVARELFAALDHPSFLVATLDHPSFLAAAS